MVKFKINTFDDGNQKYKEFINEWIIIDVMKYGGKLKIQNSINPKIIINSISRWKVTKEH